MSYIYKSISGSTATVLLSGQSYSGAQTVVEGLKAIVITNTHATDSCTVDLYLSKTIRDPHVPGHLGDWNDRVDVETTHYLIKGIIIPVGVTLLLEGHDITYNHEDFDLVYIKLGASGSTVDVKSYLSIVGESATPYKRSRIGQNSPELRRGSYTGIDFK